MYDYVALYPTYTIVRAVLFLVAAAFWILYFREILFRPGRIRTQWLKKGLADLALLLFIDHPWPNVNEKTTPGTGKSCPPNFQSARHIRDAAGWLNSCDRTAQGHAIRGERQYRRRIAFRAKQ